MTHWCDYGNFAEKLRWLADQDNEKIEEFFFDLSQTQSDHACFPGMSQSAIYEHSKDAGGETIFHYPS